MCVCVCVHIWWTPCYFAFRNPLPSECHMLRWWGVRCSMSTFPSSSIQQAYATLAKKKKTRPRVGNIGGKLSLISCLRRHACLLHPWNRTFYFNSNSFSSKTWSQTKCVGVTDETPLKSKPSIYRNSWWRCGDQRRGEKFSSEKQSDGGEKMGWRIPALCLTFLQSS